MKTVAATLTAVSALALVGAAHASEPIAEAGDFLVRLRSIAIIPMEDAEIETIGGGVEISNEAVPEIDFTYFLTDNVAFELIAATARHQVTANNTAAGNLDLGFVRHVPPTLLLQYHVQGLGPVKPYLGLGVNYTIFTEQDSEGVNVDYDNSFSYAGQIGADVRLTERAFFNVDLKYIDIDSDVTVRALGTELQADVDIDPIVLGFGVGYRF